MSVDDTLTERVTRYGNFLEGADIWVQLQRVLAAQPGFGNFMPDAQYAATMILMKLARALNGNPDDTDNWHDIQGYAKLVEDRILERGIYAKPEAAGVEDVSGAQVVCTCNVAPGGKVGKGINCAYHRTGCPARTWFDSSYPGRSPR